MNKLNNLDDLQIIIKSLLNDLDKDDAEEDDFYNVLERVKSIPRILQEAHFDNEDEKEKIKNLLILLSEKTDKIRKKLNIKAQEVSSKIEDTRETNRILKRYNKVSSSLKK